MKHLYQSHLLIILATLLVAGSFISADKLAGVVNPFSLTLLRFLSAAIFLLPLILISQKWRQSLGGIMPRALGISLFYAAFFIALFESLQYTSTVNTATLFTLVPFVTAVLCLLIFKTKIEHKKLLAYLLGAIGTCWVIFKGDLQDFIHFELNKGDMIFLAGALSMCFYSISMKWLYRGDEMIPLVFCTLIGGSIWMVLALLITGLPLQWELIEGPLFAHMSYLVIAATLLTMYLFQRATIDLGPSKVMAYSYLNPAVLVLLLFLIEGVSVQLIIIPGIIVTGISTFVLQSGKS